MTDRPVFSADDLIDTVIDAGPAVSDDTPEQRHWAALHNLMFHSRLPAGDAIKNLGLWHPAPYVARLATFTDLWRRYIADTNGSIVQFGVRYGQDLVWLLQLRGLFEPYSWRSIIGFDTFAGHLGHTNIDGSDWMTQDGAFDVPDDHYQFLMHLLAVHASAARPGASNGGVPFFLFEGDVRKTLPEALEKELSGLVVGAAFFDLDLYEPTAAALEAILPRCHDNTLLVFDELDSNRMPGETQAVLDTVGLKGLKLEQDPWGSMAWTRLGA